MCSQDLWEMQSLQDQRDLMGLMNEEGEEIILETPYDLYDLLTKINPKINE
jgi:hypothetical protein